MLLSVLLLYIHASLSYTGLGIIKRDLRKQNEQNNNSLEHVNNLEQETKLTQEEEQYAPPSLDPGVEDDQHQAELILNSPIQRKFIVCYQHGQSECELAGR